MCKWEVYSVEVVQVSSDHNSRSGNGMLRKIREALRTEAVLMEISVTLQRFGKRHGMALQRQKS